MAVISNYGPDDLAEYVRLINEIDALEGLDKASSIEHARERLGEPGFHPDKDIFLAREHRILVGYAEARPELGIGRVVLDGAVHPMWRRRGMGTALLDAAVERGHELGAETVQVAVPEKMAVSRRFVEKRGFHLVRRHWRMRLTDYAGGAAAVPSGSELCHFVPGDEEALCAIQNAAFAGSWGFCPNTIEQISHLVKSHLCRPEGILFVCEGGRKVAYCWTAYDATDTGKAHVRMIGVDPAYRGLGLGRVVLAEAIDHLRARGILELELLVDSDNTPARRLYESVGFVRADAVLWYERRLLPTSPR